jgi:hypothetical protein
MIILPTLGRPHLLKRFIEAYHSTQASAAVCLVFDASDSTLPEYAKLEIPEWWLKASVPSGTSLPTLQNLLFRQFPDRGYYGFMSDDCVPETRNWDVILAGAAMYRAGIAWGDDSIQGARLATHPFIDGELARRIGWITPPHFKRFYTDNVITEIARALGRDVYLPHVKTTHYHHMNGKAQIDATYEAANTDVNMQGDRTVFEIFMKEEFPRLIERIRYES